MGKKGLEGQKGPNPTKWVAFMQRLTRQAVRSLACRASTHPFLQSLAPVRARIRNVRSLSLSARFGGGTESASHKPGLRKLALRTWALRAWRGRECRLQSLPFEGLAASVISHSEASHFPKDLQGVHLLLAPWLSGLVHSSSPHSNAPALPGACSAQPRTACGCLDGSAKLPSPPLPTPRRPQCGGFLSNTSALRGPRVHLLAVRPFARLRGFPVRRAGLQTLAVRRLPSSTPSLRLAGLHLLALHGALWCERDFPVRSCPHHRTGLHGPHACKLGWQKVVLYFASLQLSSLAP